jgi:hypothetical protein
MAVDQSEDVIGDEIGDEEPGEEEVPATAEGQAAPAWNRRPARKGAFAEIAIGIADQAEFAGCQAPSWGEKSSATKSSV